MDIKTEAQNIVKHYISQYGGEVKKQPTKKLTIFTGLKDGERFFDHFLNDEGFTSEEYADCIRHDFELSEAAQDSSINYLLQDAEAFQTCLKGVSQTELNKFIHGAYLNDLERELISDHVTDKARKMVIDLWIQNCLFDVRLKYKEDK